MNGERKKGIGKGSGKQDTGGETRTICMYGARKGFVYSHSGDNGRKDPPVPIPNTEVKLSRAESTCRDTDREDRSSPLFNFIDCRQRQSTDCSLAQPVEHRTVNPSVVSSSLTGAAKPLESNISSGFFVLFFRFCVVCNRYMCCSGASDTPKKASGGKWGKILIVKFPDFL